jgi:pimeloyl-ACP methyl ester carboxylesterase
MSCADLGTHLSTQPNVQPYVPPPTTANPTPAPLPLTSITGTRCEANFIYSSRGGPRHGYAVGQNQRIGLRVGFPLNSLDGGVGGVEGAWNGKVRNLGGGGLQGGLSQVTNATNNGYVGSNTDSGHPSSDNPNFAVIQETHELNEGRLDDFLNESLRQQYRWALRLTKEYYGQRASRNYWDGCSTGGRQGLALALRHAEDFDGFLVGAPANFHTRLQVATVWPSWINKDVAGNTLTNAQMQAANASAVAACDADDGVTDGLVRDPRTCTFDATSNICGQPGAPATPACLTPQQADAVNLIWDGPRNDHGKRIWFPFGKGANASVTSTPPFGGPCGSLGIFCWSHRDTTFDWQSLPLSQFDNETQLATRVVAPHSDIISVDLDEAKRSRVKIIMWHGESDQLIPWRQSVHYYREAAQRYDGFDRLQKWFRFYTAPGVGHCSGGAGPQPQALFDTMVNWVENGVAPDRILSLNGPATAPTRTRPMCPYPQTAIYQGGDPNLESSFRCGGNMETKENLCMDLVAKYQHETRDHLDTKGLDHPNACKPRRGHGHHHGHGHHGHDDD